MIEKWGANQILRVGHIRSLIFLILIGLAAPAVASVDVPFSIRTCDSLFETSLVLDIANIHSQADLFEAVGLPAVEMAPGHREELTAKFMELLANQSDHQFLSSTQYKLSPQILVYPDPNGVRVDFGNGRSVVIRK